MACEDAIVPFVHTAKAIIALCIKDLKKFGLETKFESTRPIPQKIGLEESRPTSLFTAEGYKVAVNFWLQPNFFVVTVLKLIIISIFYSGMNTRLNMLIYE